MKKHKNIPQKITWTRKKLMALGIPAVLIPGILTAVVLGWNPSTLTSVSDYHQIQSLFPKTGVVGEVYDGDTFKLVNGTEVRLIGMNAPNRGEVNYDEAKRYLNDRIDKKRVYLEYDRYQDDKYGRVLAWVWTNCEETPAFLPADYMHLTYNSSREGLTENPKGCKEGVLVNEEMVKQGLAANERYKDRGELKYEKRLDGIK